jgi:hypothetical protein
LVNAITDFDDFFRMSVSIQLPKKLPKSEKIMRLKMSHTYFEMFGLVWYEAITFRRFGSATNEAPADDSYNATVLVSYLK